MDLRTSGSWWPLNRTETVLLAAIAVVILLTGMLDRQHSYFKSPGASAQTIVRHTALQGIIALGAAVVIIAGGIDLSAGSVIAFSGAVCGSLLLLMAPEEMKTGAPLPFSVKALAVAGTLLVGFLIGSFHAWLITAVRLPPFVATLATLVGLRSFARVLVENVTLATLGGRSSQINIFDPGFRVLVTKLWIPILLCLGLAMAVWVMLSFTVTGRHLYALGGNEQAARLSGIRTDRLKWLAYSLSAVFSSLAGVLYICDTSVAHPETLGRGYELNAIASAVVGGCSLQGGVGTVLGTMLGVLFLRTVVDGVAKIIKASAELYEGLIVGSVVVAAVAVNQLRAAAQRGQRFLPGWLGGVMVIALSLVAGSIAAVFAQNFFAGSTVKLSPRAAFFQAAGLVFVALAGWKWFEARREALSRISGGLAVERD